MKERFSLTPAAYLLLIRDGAILLQRRFNTGYMDGWYGLPSGHIDGNETVRHGAAREAAEEVGLDLNPADLDLVHVMHRKAENGEWVDFFLQPNTSFGEPRNCEPHKCDELRWCPIDALPDGTIDYVRAALLCVREGQVYSEFGFGAAPEERPQ